MSRRALIALVRRGLPRRTGVRPGRRRRGPLATGGGAGHRTRRAPRRRAVSSHTGALASDGAAMSTPPAGRPGSTGCRTPREMIDTAHAPLRCPPARGGGWPSSPTAAATAASPPAVAADLACPLPELRRRPPDGRRAAARRRRRQQSGGPGRGRRAGRPYPRPRGPALLASDQADALPHHRLLRRLRRVPSAAEEKRGAGGARRHGRRTGRPVVVHTDVPPRRRCPAARPRASPCTRPWSRQRPRWPGSPTLAPREPRPAPDLPPPGAEAAGDGYDAARPPLMPAGCPRRPAHRSTRAQALAAAEAPATRSCSRRSAPCTSPRAAAWCSACRMRPRSLQRLRACGPPGPTGLQRRGDGAARRRRGAAHRRSLGSPLRPGRAGRSRRDLCRGAAGHHGRAGAGR